MFILFYCYILFNMIFIITFNTIELSLNSLAYTTTICVIFFSLYNLILHKIFKVNNSNNQKNTLLFQLSRNYLKSSYMGLVTMWGFKFNSKRFFLLKFLNNTKKQTKHILKWKPLFKKSSYYGIYRTNKNKWLNK